MEESIKALLVFIGMLIVVALLFALPTMWLWNWLMPHLFNLKQIGFWEALGLVALTRFLFPSISSSKS